MAADVIDARRQLAAANKTVLLLKRAPRSATRSAPPRQEVTWWCKELCTLIRSGMTVVEATETMTASSAPGSRRQKTQTALLSELEKGHSLSQAMRRVQGYPAVLVASISSAEQSSKLVESITEYLLYEETANRLKRQLVSAAIYPTLVTTLGTAITILLLIVVIPRFAGMYADMPSGSVSTVTRAIVWASNLLTHSATSVGLSIAGFTLLIAASWRNGQLRNVASNFAENVTWIAVQLNHFRLAQLYHALGLMMKGGYPLQEALMVCSEMPLSEEVLRRLHSLKTSVEAGMPLGPAFAKCGLADIVSERLLAVGERSGEFPLVLSAVAERHGEEFTTFIERSTRLIEPILLLFVALVIGSIVLAMYLPIFEIAGQIGVERPR